MYQNEVTISQHNTILRESKEAVKFEETNKELISQGKEPKPTPEKFTTALIVF